MGEEEPRACDTSTYRAPSPNPRMHTEAETSRFSAEQCMHSVRMPPPGMYPSYVSPLLHPTHKHSRTGQEMPTGYQQPAASVPMEEGNAMPSGTQAPYPVRIPLLTNACA